ncbi:MAG TPA: hypothetical protein DF984_01015 [Anaerolineaceae bacterium]|nr:hypothetical protein [Anaerolineaceae bacterium]
MLERNHFDKNFNFQLNDFGSVLSGRMKHQRIIQKRPELIFAIISQYIKHYSAMLMYSYILHPERLVSGIASGIHIIF